MMLRFQFKIAGPCVVVFFFFAFRFLSVFLWMITDSRADRDGGMKATIIIHNHQQIFFPPG